MKMKEEEYDVGVLVGRFQVDELHPAHHALFGHVCEAHSKVLLFLGQSLVLGTRNNPLDFQARKQMVAADYPDILINPIKDMNSDEAWSKKLDRLIVDLLTPDQTLVLYGGRESFIDRYHGRFATRELMQEEWISGTKIRKDIARSSTVGTKEFRQGVIWGTSNRHETAFHTVDVAVFNEDETKLFLGKRDYEDGWRFFGGFVMPRTGGAKANARREVREESGIEITDPWFIDSLDVDDPRYRGEVDGITTTLFGAHYQFGQPRPGDDIDRVAWFDLATLRPTDLVEIHRPLLAAVLKDAEARRPR